MWYAYFQFQKYWKSVLTPVHSVNPDIENPLPIFYGSQTFFTYYAILSSHRSIPAPLAFVYCIIVLYPNPRKLGTLGEF